MLQGNPGASTVNLAPELFKLPLTAFFKENPLQISFKSWAFGDNFEIHRGGNNEIAVSVKKGVTLSEEENEFLSYCDKLDQTDAMRSKRQCFREISRLFSPHIEQVSGWKLGKKGEFDFSVKTTSLEDYIKANVSEMVAFRSKIKFPMPSPLNLTTENGSSEVLDYLNAPKLSQDFCWVGDTLPGTWAEFPRELAVTEVAKRKEALQLCKAGESCRTIATILNNMPQLSGNVSVELRNSMARQLAVFADYTADIIKPLMLNKMAEGLKLKALIRRRMTEGFKPEAIKAKLRNSPLLSKGLFKQEDIEAADKTATEARFFKGSKVAPKRPVEQNQTLASSKRFKSGVPTEASTSAKSAAPLAYQSPYSYQSNSYKRGELGLQQRGGSRPAVQRGIASQLSMSRARPFRAGCGISRGSGMQTRFVRGRGRPQQQ